MKIYKFKDGVDGKFAFIIADTQHDATNFLESLTSITFTCIARKEFKDLDKPLVLVNHILPF